MRGVAKLIKQLEVKGGFTRWEIAQELGVPPIRIYNWLRGKSRPDAAELRSLEFLLSRVENGWFTGRKMPSSDIGKRIWYLRKKYDLTQGGLAALLGVNTVTISHWERGYAVPSSLAMHRLSQVEKDLKNAVPRKRRKKKKPLTSGQKIRRLRKRYGLRQADLAALLGVNTVTISRWERGYAVPSSLAVHRLAQVERGLKNEVSRKK